MSSNKYQVKSDRDHVLHRRDMWLGNSSNCEELMYLYDVTNNQLTYEKIKYNAAVIKLFDEILVNAIDNLSRSSLDCRMTEIKVDFIRIPGYKELGIKIYNNGPSISIEKYKMEDRREYETENQFKMRKDIEEKLNEKYIPEIVFTVLRSSSNYDENEDETRTTGGLNGVGAKLTSIFSKYFHIEIENPGKKYSQIILNNIDEIKEPKIIETENNNSSVSITFIPDWEKIDPSKEFINLDINLIKILSKRVFDYSHINIDLYILGRKLPRLSYLEFSEKHLKLHDPEIRLMNISTSDKFSNWKICIGFSMKKIDKISYVNNVVTYEGGSHVEKIRDQIVEFIKSKIKSKDEINKKIITSRIAVSIYSIIGGPRFGGQSKTKLIMPKLEVPKISQVELTEFINNNDVINLITKSRVKSSNNKTIRSRLTNISKLRDAEEAGKPLSSRINKHPCVLFICEGDSAQTLTTRGIEILGEKYYGSFALRGKVLNTLKSSDAKYVQNKELTDLKSAIGLVDNKKYTCTDSLRYQKVVCCKDADYDGSSIMGLVINFFYQYFRELMELDDFFYEFITPVINIYRSPYIPKSSTILKSYYNLNLFNQEMKNQEMKNIEVKYIKGLGGNTDLDIETYFKSFVQNMIKINCNNEKTENYIKLAYSNEKFKKDDKQIYNYYPKEDIDSIDKVTSMADLRKIWISKVNEDSYLPREEGGSIEFNDFCQIDLALASYDSCQRSIPSIIDGLKPSQRKVLYTFFNMSQSKAKKSTKIYQITGKVASFAQYHHGDASLNEAITKMGQDFIGSNNLPLLEKDGQFGSRNKLGQDASQPRYIAAFLSDVSRILFPKIDDDLLRRQMEDNNLVEPIYYIPIIPTVLINGAVGIGTGWSTNIPMFNPFDLISKTSEAIINYPNKPLINLKPWYRNYKGKTFDTDSGWIFVGNVTKVSSYVYEIDEIPVNMSIDELRDNMNQLINDGLLKNYQSVKLDKTIKRIPDQFKFKLDFNKDKFEIVELNEITVIQLLNLKTSIKKTNMVGFDHDNHVKRFKTVSEIFYEWFETRRLLYVKRYGKILEIVEKEIRKLYNKIKFAENEDKYDLRNKNNEEIEKLLINEKYDKFNDSYEYLLSMPVSNLTKIKITEMIELLKKKKIEYDDLKKKTYFDLWITDLLELHKYLKKNYE